MSRKTAIVFGASGYVGNAVASSLSRVGFKTYGLIRNKDKASQLITQEIIPVIGSLNDRHTWIKTLDQIQFDLIINCSDVVMSPENNIHNCLDALNDLVLNCKGSKIPLFIFSSGAMIYGDCGRVGEPGFRGVSEDCPYNPPIPKFLIPEVEELFKRNDLLSCVLIPCFVYGRSSSNSVHGSLFQQAKASSNVLKYAGCPTSVIHGVHIDDLAQAYVLAAQKPELVNRQKFNVAGDKYDTFDEVLKAISKEFGGKHKIEYGGGKGDTPALSVSQWMVTDKIKRVLGWKPVKPSFTDGIKEYVAAWEESKA